MPDTPLASIRAIPAPPRFPAELEDAYEPIRLLGGGRAGQVWHARERSGRRTVALKVARRDADSADIEWRRCQREGRVARRLKHRHAVGVVDSGVRGEVAYCAWRFCGHGTLAARQDAGERLAVAAIVTLVREIAAALEHARERGVWHGALSPHAVLFDTTGRAQLADFRIVQDDDHPEDEMPLAARIPTYHAPEQHPRSPHAVGPQVDQYALGLIAYELLTGDRRDSRVGESSMYALEVLEVREHRELRPGLPLAVNAVLRRALDADPDARFETAQAFADALAEASEPPPPPPEPEPAEEAEAEASPLVLFTWRPRKGREIPVTVQLLATMGAATVILTTLVAWAVSRVVSRTGDEGRVRPTPVTWAARRSAPPPPIPFVPGPSGEVSPRAFAQLDARRRLGEVLVVPLSASPGAVAVIEDIVRGAVPRVVRLQPGVYRVAVRDPRRTYAPAETTVTVTSGARITVNFR